VITPLASTYVKTNRIATTVLVLRLTHETHSWCTIPEPNENAFVTRIGAVRSDDEHGERTGGAVHTGIIGMRGCFASSAAAVAYPVYGMPPRAASALC